MTSLRPITIPGTDVQIGTIGFGCNAILTDTLGRGDGLALLHTAYELGVRHFDTARSYCGGESEYLLGEFARKRRGEITITTKFRVNLSGEQAENPAKRYVRRYIAGASAVKQAKPLVKKLLGRGAESGNNLLVSPTQPAPPTPSTPREPVNLSFVRQSLETSLRELGTDYVDLFFVHEGELADCQTPGLQELLQQFVQEGKIRAYGVGSSFERVLAINAEMPQFAQVFQFESSALKPHVQAVQEARQASGVAPALLSTHGAVAALAPLRARLQNPDFAQTFTSTFGTNATQAPQLAALLLRFARYENPDGIILFRSTKRENLRANTEALTGSSPYTDAQLLQLAALLAGITA